jgi:GNAT superfamily N-acetyltransferase
LTVAVRIRDARRDDVALIFGWIVELAEYERAPEQVSGTPELLEDALFGPAPSAEAVIAETRDEAVPDAATTAAGATTRTVDATTTTADANHWQPAGFALFHSTFSTWESRPGIWLEDLYVPPVHRRSGVGAALLARLAQIAVARGYARLEWAALDWNEPALNFYGKIGARRLDDWILHRLDGGGLERIAGTTGTAG